MRIVTLLLVICFAIPCFAQGNVKVGSYSQDNYNGLYASVTERKLSWYHREGLGQGANLDVVKYRLSKEAGLILRVDSPQSGSFTRFGGWLEDKRYGKVEIIGGSGKALRADVYSAPVKLAEGLTLDGWMHAEQDKKPDFWVGPTVKLGTDVQVYYRHNLRSGGSWVTGCDWTVFKW